MAYIYDFYRGVGPDQSTSEIGDRVTRLRRQMGRLEEHENTLDM